MVAECPTRRGEDLVRGCTANGGAPNREGARRGRGASDRRRHREVGTDHAAVGAEFEYLHGNPPLYRRAQPISAQLRIGMEVNTCVEVIVASVFRPVVLVC